MTNPSFTPNWPWADDILFASAEFNSFSPDEAEFNYETGEHIFMSDEHGTLVVDQSGTITVRNEP